MDIDAIALHVRRLIDSERRLLDILPDLEEIVADYRDHKASLGAREAAQAPEIAEPEMTPSPTVPPETLPAVTDAPATASPETDQPAATDAPADIGPTATPTPVPSPTAEPTVPPEQTSAAPAI